ncbi:MAG: polymer-forming cytoskeletal protein [Nitrospirales bacterium]|nr:polymer-forming cytoskeletal protein [Nitrospira sp.]MDR4500018.1 polymer-forming cytoskeletal protein [Nitrospirales bacterium]
MRKEIVNSGSSNQKILGRDQSFELYISKGSHVQGIFHVRGMARVDGYVEGEIHTDQTLHIGKDAVIVADIRADHLITQGPIRGDIMACRQVDLLAPAIVEGAISTPKFTLEDGVQVSGTLKMDRR